MGKLIWCDIELPVLKARVIVAIGSEKKFTKAIGKHGLDHEPMECLARCYYRRDFSDGPLGFRNVIFSKSAAMSVIAHEAVHAANNILHGMGVVADFRNDEVQAYIVQYICEQVEEALGHVS